MLENIKIYLVIFLLLIPSIELYSQQKNSMKSPTFAGAFEYSLFAKNYHSVGMRGLYFNSPKNKLVFTYGFGVSFTNNDRFNHGKGNASLFQLLANLFTAKFDCPVGSKPNYHFALPLLLLNSKLYYYPNLKNLKFETFPNRAIGLFIKNSSDIWLFQRKNYISINPAIGLSYSDGGVLFDLGLSHSINFDFTKNYNDRYAYLSITFDLAGFLLD